MRKRDHVSQHVAAEDLPLLTESAIVTDVSPMDHSRNDEVLAELRSTLDEHATGKWNRERPSDEEACENWIGRRLSSIDHLDSETPLNRFLPGDTAMEAVSEKLAGLQARYLQPYPSLFRIKIETDDPVEYLPGQYLSVRYRDTTRVYSVACSPTSDEIEFCVRRVPGGQMTSELAVDLEAGDTVTLRGPYGDFLLDDPSPRDVVFLATGTGVAPLKSMLDYIFETGRDSHQGEQRDIWLILGSAWKDTLPYRDAFRSMADARENFQFVPTLSRESYLTDWKGETAYVQYSLVKYLDGESLGERVLPEEFERYRTKQPCTQIEAQLDPSDMEVYACGINAMVFGLVEAVSQLGVPEEYTQFEGFG